MKLFCSFNAQNCGRMVFWYCTTFRSDLCRERIASCVLRCVVWCCFAAIEDVFIQEVVPHTSWILVKAKIKEMSVMSYNVYSLQQTVDNKDIFVSLNLILSEGFTNTNIVRQVLEANKFSNQNLSFSLFLCEIVKKISI